MGRRQGCTGNLPPITSECHVPSGPQQLQPAITCSTIAPNRKSDLTTLRKTMRMSSPSRHVEGRHRAATPSTSFFIPSDQAFAAWSASGAAGMAYSTADGRDGMQRTNNATHLVPNQHNSQMTNSQMMADGTILHPTHASSSSSLFITAISFHDK